MKEEEITADSCAETAENVCQELCKLDVDTEHVGTLVIAADSIEITSYLGPSEEDKHQDNDDKCNYHSDLNTQMSYTSYLKAVLAARTNDANGVVSNLRTAIEKDSSLAARAAKDLEFAAYAAQIAGIVK